MLNIIRIIKPRIAVQARSLHRQGMVAAPVAMNTVHRNYTKISEYTASDYLSPEEFERFLAAKNKELKEYLSGAEVKAEEMMNNGHNSITDALDADMFDALAKDFARQCKDHHHNE
ncbi:hypothetical protein H4219_000016 [Mycoemilia scoparia]|uniref:Uncharacterized protein n=1 Tax=Mycoemilia scoparia TaxID=417184 RepID=A0A9W8ACH1_9FUNG|nr:hypothetical protein H4219_000016 [Mycoemilia scoparia]